MFVRFHLILHAILIAAGLYRELLVHSLLINTDWLSINMQQVEGWDHTNSD